MRVFVAIPNNGQITIENARCLLNMTREVEDIEFGFYKSCLVHENRNELVKEAKRNMADYILFIDSDTAVDDGTLKTLLKHNKDIIGAPVYLKKDVREHNVKDENREPLDLKDKMFPLKCGYIGSAVLLVKMDVFKKLKRPYFNHSYDKNGEMYMGEDHYFCHQARKAGFDIWVDPTIKTIHVGVKHYS